MQLHGSHRPQDADFISRDAEAAAAKRTLMRRLKTNSMLNSVSKVSAFIAGPLFAAGILKAAAVVFEASTFSAGIAAVAAAPVTLGILAVGAAFAVAAVAADYAASRSWQSNSIDTQEATAQSNARNLVREMEAHNLCITSKDNVVHEPPQRRDGKTWAQAVSEQQQQQATR